MSKQWNRLGRRPRQPNGSEKEGPKPGREKSPLFGDYRPRRETTILRFRHGSSMTDNFTEKEFCRILLYTFLEIRWYRVRHLQRIHVFWYKLYKSSPKEPLFHTRHGEGKEGEESGQSLQESIPRAAGKGFVQSGIFVVLTC